MPLRTQESLECRMTVQSFMEIEWTVFEKFEVFMKRSREKIKKIPTTKNRKKQRLF